jgi:hypothetical protein
MRWLAGRRSVWWALAFAGVAQLGLALSPYLVDRAPLLLLVLRPQPELVVLLAGHAPAFAVIAIVAPLRWTLHLVYFEVGRWAGGDVLVRSQPGRWLLPRLANRQLSRLLMLVCLVHLSTPVDLALGAGRVDRSRVALLLAVGSVVTTVLFVAVGVQMAPVTARALTWVVDNRPVAAAFALAAALVGLIAAQRRLRVRGRG